VRNCTVSRASVLSMQFDRTQFSKAAGIADSVAKISTSAGLTGHVCGLMLPNMPDAESILQRAPAVGSSPVGADPGGPTRRLDEFCASLRLRLALCQRLKITCRQDSNREGDRTKPVVGHGARPTSGPVRALLTERFRECCEAIK
jgi:hypothetical protein